MDNQFDSVFVALAALPASSSEYVVLATLLICFSTQIKARLKPDSTHLYLGNQHSYFKNIARRTKFPPAIDQQQ